jgi:hypothetical protein
MTCYYKFTYDADRLSFEELENRIRNRAYQLYEDRGCADGRALDDWLNAKAQVLGVTKTPTAA